MTAAVRGLEKEYEGRVEFRVLPAEGEEGRAAVERNGWGDRLHGLEAVAPDGTVVGHLPGHDYGRDAIVEKVEALLATTAK